jgi:hypothetical protein
MTKAESKAWDARIDALITERDALWARYDELVAAHGVWSREADATLLAASRADDAADALSRDYNIAVNP